MTSKSTVGDGGDTQTTSPDTDCWDPDIITGTEDPVWAYEGQRQALLGMAPQGL